MSSFNFDFLDEPAGGLRLADLVGADLTAATPAGPAEGASPAGTTTSTGGMEWSPQQQAAIDAVTTWYQRARAAGIRGVISIDERDQVYRLFGYAGTGKTTLARHIVDALGLTRVTFAAFTGKAAYVLRQKGCEGASTVHSLIYQPVEKVRAHLEKLRAQLAETTDPAERQTLRGEIAREQAKVDSPDWILREESELEHTQLLVLDEVSMVSERMARDILSYGCPVLCLGDPAQLPPVDGGGYFINAAPDHLLTEIHRSALDSPVTRLATAIRSSQPGQRDYGVRGRDGDSGRIEQLSLDEVLSFDQILVGKNATRWQACHLMRALRGLTGQLPVAGDRIICLANSGDAGVFNGQQFDVLAGRIVDPRGDRYELDVRDDEGLERTLTAWACGFKDLEGEKQAKRDGRGSVIAATFAQAITVHKCVHPDTLVETPDGVMPIRDIPKSGTIATPDGPRTYHSKFTRAAGPVLTIGTRRGFELTVTPEHGLTVWRGGHVRVPAADLLPGDWLRVRLGATTDPAGPPALPDPPVLDVRAVVHKLPSRMSAELAEFIGLMVADGTIYGPGRGFRLAKRHFDVVDRFAHLVKDLFGYDATRGHIAGTPSADVNSTQIAGWLLAIGGMAPKTKHVPDVILRSPLAVQAAFLRGLFEDGTVNLRGSHVDHIAWSNSSHKVAGVVQTMLLRHGIVATRSTYGDGIRLCLYGPHAARFATQIGFVADAKNARLDGATFGNDVRNPIPVTRAELASLERWMGVSDKQNARRNGHISRTVANKIIDASGGVPFLAERLNWHYERVTSIEHGTAETMCVTVPDGNRFLQNGFDGWNSQGSQWDNVLVIDESSVFYGAAFREHEKLLGRDGAAIEAHINGQRWAYTAVTRAAKRIVIAPRLNGLVRG